jgi:hypothetical protein
VKNWRIPEAELLQRLRSLHQSSSGGEQEQAALTTNTKGGKPALFTRIGFKSTTMEQIQAIFFFLMEQIQAIFFFLRFGGTLPLF